MVAIHVFLRFGQHPTGTAGRVKHLAHRTRRGEEVIVIDEEQMNHEADNLTRGEVISGGLVGLLIEPADQVFKNAPHEVVVHLFGMKVNIAEFGNDEVDDIGITHPLYLGSEFEIVEYLTHILGKAVDVGS